MERTRSKSLAESALEAATTHSTREVYRND